MKLFFRIACLVLLLSGTRAQDLGFDLADALDDVVTPKPKALDPAKPKDDFFNLEDALGGDDDPPPAQPNPPVNNNPNSGGGGGTIKDSDLNDLLDLGGGGGGGGQYEPDGGHGYGGGGYDDRGGRGEGPAYNPAYDDNNGGNQQDGEFEWGRILKMLNANMPEDFFLWMSNVKQRLAPLLERVLDLLNTLPGDEQQEL